MKQFLIITSYRVGIRTCSDYSPFGVELDGRTVSGGYRFGYQGSEKDNETKGNGNSYTTEFRQLDPRLGRWLSVDPETGDYPGHSSYTAFENDPIYFIDPNGGSSNPSWLPFVVYALEGAIAGGASEFVFQVADQIIFNGLDVNSAINTVDWSNVTVEAGTGFITNSLTFNGYAAAKISMLFGGKYRKMSMYFIKQGFDLLESTLNDYSKDCFNGMEIDLASSFKEAVGNAIFSEMMNSKSFINSGFSRGAVRINNKVEKATEINKKIKIARNQLSKTSEPKERNKIEKNISKMNRLLNNKESKAVKILANQYKKLSGQSSDKLENRAREIIAAKVRVEITVEPPIHSNQPEK